VTDNRTTHGISNVKLISAQQGREINNYKNTKEKLLKTNAAIWFNKICKIDQLTPHIGPASIRKDFGAPP
jgi:hypothetical protein